ncbi:MAG: hypothetical protein IPN89_10850 [Saprospiraceae bacterium]|nr:hypothetical protein [Saprospiraceae bacterium]
MQRSTVTGLSRNSYQQCYQIHSRSRLQKTGIPEASGVCTNPEIQFRDREVTDRWNRLYRKKFVKSKRKIYIRTCVQRITILPKYKCAAMGN